jgi:uncharacterized protein
MNLVWLPGEFAVARLAAGAPLPAWALRSPFHSVTRTPEELSVVCATEDLPETVVAERGWRCLRVAGRLDFSLTGILHSMTSPLAGVGVSLFALSTYDTDYILVPARVADVATAALRRAGHEMADPPGAASVC